MKKRGISAVVATVLIILIVVAGIGIVWKVILPLFAKLDYLSYSDVQLNIVFQGYTIYDPDMKFAFVQIKRGQDEVDITGLEIGFNFEGTTKTYQTTAVPEPGGKHTYKFNFTADGLADEGDPDKVTVAPIFILNNQIKLGEILDEETMPLGKVYLSINEWKDARIEAEDNSIVTHTGPGDQPGCAPNCTGASCGDDNGCEGKCIVQDCGLNMKCDSSGECVEDYEEIPESCGNGTLDLGESCDDGNNLDGDGCSADCKIEISDCATLDQIGKSYVLTNDISGGENDACIIIEANDTTFDGQGHTIDVTHSGAGAHGRYGAGIATEPVYPEKWLSGVTVKNTVITNAKSQGVYFQQTIDSTISGINSSNNKEYHGILLFITKRILIENNILNDNAQYGLAALFSTPEDLSLKNNQICNNRDTDIVLGSGTHTDLGGNTYLTEDVGDWLGPSAGTCPPATGAIYGCGAILDQEGNTYYLTQDINNYEDGACITIAANDITLEGNNHKITDPRTTYNKRDIIYANSLTGITIKNILLEGGSDNIYLNNIDNSLMKNITTRNAHYNGFKVWNSEGTIFEENTMTGNSWEGIWFYFSSANIVRNNMIRDNGWGLWFESGSIDNQIEGNTICNTELDLECQPWGWGDIQNQIDLGGNTYSTNNSCDAWLQPSVGICSA